MSLDEEIDIANRFGRLNDELIAFAEHVVEDWNILGYTVEEHDNSINTIVFNATNIERIDMDRNKYKDLFVEILSMLIICGIKKKEYDESYGCFRFVFAGGKL